MTDPTQSYSDETRTEAATRFALALREAAAKATLVGPLAVEDDGWGARFAVSYTHAQDEYAAIPFDVIVRARQ